LQDLFVASNLSRVLHKYCNSTALVKKISH
jgi:hypothetical protein